MAELENLSILDLNNLGVSLCASGEYDRGIVLLREAQACSPNDPDICCSLGNALAEHGQIEDAMHYFTHAIHIDPHHFVAQQLLRSVQHLRSTPNAPFNIPDEPPTSPFGEVAIQSAEIVSPGEASRANVLQHLGKKSWLPLVVIALLSLVAGRALYRLMNPFSAATDVSQGEYRFTIGQVMDDTLSSRAGMMHAVLDVPTFALPPDEVRHTKNYFQINGINKATEMVGVTGMEGKLTAFSRKNGETTDLQALPGDNESSAASINNFGDIVGYSGTETHRAVLWSEGQILNLNDRILKNAGLVLTDALTIDDTGSIVAAAVDSRGNKKVLRLIPAN